MGFKKSPRDHKHIGEEVEDYLDRLAEKGLQSDEKFAESYIRMRSQVGYGPRRITQELQQKGIAEETIYRFYEELELDWYQIALAIWQKKYNQLPGSDLKLKAKQSRFLQYRGFDFDIINWLFSRKQDVDEH